MKKHISLTIANCNLFNFHIFSVRHHPVLSTHPSNAFPVFCKSFLRVKIQDHESGCYYLTRVSPQFIIRKIFKDWFCVICTKFIISFCTVYSKDRNSKHKHKLVAQRLWITMYLLELFQHTHRKEFEIYIYLGWLVVSVWLTWCQ